MARQGLARAADAAVPHSDGRSASTLTADRDERRQRPKFLPASHPTAFEAGVGAAMAIGMLLGALLVPIVVLLAAWWAVEALWRLL